MLQGKFHKLISNTKGSNNEDAEYEEMKLWSMHLWIFESEKAHKKGQEASAETMEHAIG